MYLPLKGKKRYGREKATIEEFFERFQGEFPTAESLGRQPTIKDFKDFLRERLSKLTSKSESN
jgi:hypothetical protein